MCRIFKLSGAGRGAEERAVSPRFRALRTGSRERIVSKGPAQHVHGLSGIGVGLRGDVGCGAEERPVDHQVDLLGEQIPVLISELVRRAFRMEDGHALQALKARPLQQGVFRIRPVVDGKLMLDPPLSKAGDSIVLRAELDLAVALSACPAGVCNGGTPKPVAYEIFPAK